MDVLATGGACGLGDGFPCHTANVALFFHSCKPYAKPMRAIYVRASNAAERWVEREHEQTGMSRSAVVNAALEEAARRDWQITPPGAAVSETARIPGQ